MMNLARLTRAKKFYAVDFLSTTFIVYNKTGDYIQDTL